jgi:hypothetical protein
MKKNVGSIERIIRIIAGMFILSLAFVGPRSPWAYLGIMPLVTGLLGSARPTRSWACRPAKKTAKAPLGAYRCCSEHPCPVLPGRGFFVFSSGLTDAGCRRYSILETKLIVNRDFTGHGGGPRNAAGF